MEHSQKFMKYKNANVKVREVWIGIFFYVDDWESWFMALSLMPWVLCVNPLKHNT